jgi:hypothetical protein
MNNIDNKTPKNNKQFENSPHTGRSMNEFKMPNQNPYIMFKPDDDNSRGYYRGADIQDFGSSVMAFQNATTSKSFKA